MSKSAIILGATGLTGSYVLDKLLANNNYNKIIVFSRRELGIRATKLQKPVKFSFKWILFWTYCAGWYTFVSSDQ